MATTWQLHDTEEKMKGRFNLAVFLVLRDEIYAAMKEGWSVKSIWETLHQDKKILFSYQTFLKFVNQHKPEA